MNGERGRGGGARPPPGLRAGESCQSCRGELRPFSDRRKQPAVSLERRIGTPAPLLSAPGFLCFSLTELNW